MTVKQAIGARRSVEASQRNTAEPNSASRSPESPEVLFAAAKSVSSAEIELLMIVGWSVVVEGPGLDLYQREPTCTVLRDAVGCWGADWL